MPDNLGCGFDFYADLDNLFLKNNGKDPDPHYVRIFLISSTGRISIEKKGN